MQTCDSVFSYGMPLPFLLLVKDPTSLTTECHAGEISLWQMSWPIGRALIMADNTIVSQKRNSDHAQQASLKSITTLTVELLTIPPPLSK